MGSAIPRPEYVVISGCAAASPDCMIGDSVTANATSSPLGAGTRIVWGAADEPSPGAAAEPVGQRRPVEGVATGRARGDAGVVTARAFQPAAAPPTRSVAVPGGGGGVGAAPPGRRHPEEAAVSTATARR